MYTNYSLPTRFLIIIMVLLLALAVLPLNRNVADAQPRSLQLTVRNMTDKQPLLATLVVVHTDNAVLMPSTASRLEGLEEFAEGGKQPTLMETFKARRGVKHVSRFGGSIRPGASVSIQGVTAEPGDLVSVIAQLGCTNDGVVFGTALIAEDGSLPALSSGHALDVGTEPNTETKLTVPCLGGEGESKLDEADGEGSIALHPGIAGSAELSAEYGWDGQLMQIILANRGSRTASKREVGVTIENLTKGQPLGSPILVVHDRHTDVLVINRPGALKGIDDFSESGNRNRLIASLRRHPGVIEVYPLETGLPIAPGASFTWNIDAMSGSDISVLAQLSCTNDGYVLATAPIKVVSGSMVSSEAMGTMNDSGSENNHETLATVPCLGGEMAGISEGRGELNVNKHPGITGIGDLSVANHNWTDDSTVRIRIHYPGKITVVDFSKIPTSTPTPSSVPTVNPDGTDNEVEDPDTGGSAPSAAVTLIMLLAGIGLLFAGRHLIVIRK